MILNKSLPEILKQIGHDGSEVWWPENKEPMSRRGFTTQEFIDVAWANGYAMMEILQPEMWDGETLESRKLIEEFPFNRTFEERILYYMGLYSGLIVGHHNPINKHMVAWDHRSREIYDPGVRGIYDFDLELDSIIVEIFLPVIPLQNQITK
jgi:hypothetical protein